MRYANRTDAGKRLAAALEQYRGSAVVLALPRGGVVLGAEVAKELNAPLGLVLVRKIGHPASAEYAIGAVAEREKPVYNKQEAVSVDSAWLKRAETSAHELIEQRRDLYYDDDFIPPRITRKTVIVVDDGIATGLTMQAAVRAVKRKRPAHIIVAAPIASPESVAALKNEADEVIVLDNPANFLGAIGVHYKEFEQVGDQEVKTLLREVDKHIQASATWHPHKL